MTKVAAALRQWKSALLSLPLAAVTASAQIPIGSEFQVSQSGGQDPVAAMDADGNFTVVWSGPDPLGGDNFEIVMRRYDATGAPLGPSSVINADALAIQDNPDIAMRSDGSSVVVWHTAVSQTSVRARLFDATGAPLGAEFVVNDFTVGSTYYPRVATDETGRFVVVWEAGTSVVELASPSVQARLFDAAGTPVGGQFQVNTFTTLRQGFPDAVMYPDGSFMVGWTSEASVGDPSGYSVQARRFDATGTPLGGEFQVNTYTTNHQGAPTFAIDADGDVVAVWSSVGGVGGDPTTAVHARLFDPSGTPLGPEFQVNTYTTGDQGTRSVAMDADGDFVVAWQSEGSAGTDTDPSSNRSVQAQHYDASATPVGGEFQVNTTTFGFQWRPTVAMDAGSRFVIAWESPFVFPEIYAQLYEQGTSTSSTSTTSTSSTSTSSTSSTSTSSTSSSSTSSSSTTSSSAASGTSSTTTSSTTTLPPLPTTTTSSVPLPPTLPGSVNVLGKKMLVKDPSGSEDSRRVIMLAKEPGLDIVVPALSTLPMTGAQLRVVLNGTTPSDETYVLDAAGWTPLGAVGFRYRGPTGGDGDPVKQVLIKNAGGKAFIKLLIKGNTGTQDVEVVPPNTGSEGGIVLDLGGGTRYCVTFGAAAGSAQASDNARLWKALNAVTKPGCLVP